MVVEFFEVVVGGFRWLWMVLGGFRSFHVLVTTVFFTEFFHSVFSSFVVPFFKTLGGTVT